MVTFCKEGTIQVLKNLPKNILLLPVICFLNCTTENLINPHNPVTTKLRIHYEQCIANDVIIKYEKP